MIPRNERKSKEHYDFIKKYFNNPYLSYKDFMDRDDLFVLVTRENNTIIGLTLVRESIVEKKPKDEPKKKLDSGIFSLDFDRPKTPKSNKNTVWIVVYTIVDENQRGKGVNQLLLDHLTKIALLEDVKYIVANIRESNTPSINSFKKNGFKVSKKKTKDYKNGENKIKMIKFMSKGKKKLMENSRRRRSDGGLTSRPQLGRPVTEEVVRDAPEPRNRVARGGESIDYAAAYTYGMGSMSGMTASQSDSEPNTDAENTTGIQWTHLPSGGHSYMTFSSHGLEGHSSDNEPNDF